MDQDSWDLQLVYEGRDNDDGTADGILLGRSLSAFSELCHEVSALSRRPIRIRVWTGFKRGSFIVELLSSAQLRDFTQSLIANKAAIDAVVSALKALIAAGSLGGGMVLFIEKYKALRSQSIAEREKALTEKVNRDAAEHGAAHEAELKDLELEIMREASEHKRQLLNLDREAGQLRLYLSTPRANRLLKGFLSPVLEHDSDDVKLIAPGTPEVLIARKEARTLVSMTARAESEVASSEAERTTLEVRAMNRDSGKSGWRITVADETASATILDEDFLRDVRYGRRELVLGQELDAYVSRRVTITRSGKERTRFSVLRVF